VTVRGGRRCASQYDDDAITLAVQAVLALDRDGLPPPVALLFASVTPPYEEGGSAQVIAEMAGLGDELFCAELCTTPRDGLAAVRLADGLIAAGGGPVLVCAAHVRRPEGEREAGDGAVALLLGENGGLAALTPGPAHAEELRDRWRLPGDLTPRETDVSFTDELGASRVAGIVAGAVHERSPQPVSTGASAPPDATPLSAAAVLVAGPSARSAGRVERALGGPGDPAFSRTGALGAAHPLLRLLLSLQAPAVVIAASGGLGEALLVQPHEEGAELAAAIAREVAAGRDVETVPAPPAQLGFDPYSSAPRAWRERGQDLRLEGVLRDGRVLYPPPAGVAGERRALARRGRVLTLTRDHVYPGADTVEMAVVDLDDGSRFYAQVAAGEHVEIGQAVRLVPRRLHAGGGIVQYYWKLAPCR